MHGIENILCSSIKRRKLFENSLNKDKYDIYSGPLHIISFSPKGMDINDAESWTQKKRTELIKNNFMLSRPIFKNRYFLRAVLGNYNTSKDDINKLMQLLN